MTARVHQILRLRGDASPSAPMLALLHQEHEFGVATHSAESALQPVCLALQLLSGSVAEMMPW